MDAFNAFIRTLEVCTVLVLICLGLIVWRLKAEEPKGDE